MKDFRYYLILIYFNTVKDIYSYRELVNMLGLAFEQVENILIDMMKQQLLKYDNKNNLIITDTGYEKLNHKGFGDIDIYELFRNDERYHIEKNKLKKKIDLNYPYIPKKFDEKFKGYKK